MTTNINTPKNCTKPAINGSGWLAELELEISYRVDKSVVSHSKQKGPLTIQSAFYPEGDVCHLYLLHPPAGIVGGDRLQLNVTSKDKGAVLITTPGATKFYRSNGALAEQHQDFTVLDGSSLEWLPQETIFFPSANAKLNTTIHLEGSANYIGWEVYCLGLPANKKDFGDGKAQLGFSLFRENQPLLIESMNVSEVKQRYQAAFLQNKPIVGSMVATGGDEQLVETLREQLSSTKNGIWGVTLLDDIMVLRYLGSSTNEARELFIEAWKLIRPHTLGRDFTEPRIWAT